MGFRALFLPVLFTAETAKIAEKINIYSGAIYEFSKPMT